MDLFKGASTMKSNLISVTYIGIEFGLRLGIDLILPLGVPNSEIFNCYTVETLNAKNITLLDLLHSNLCHCVQ